jgi:uncharacterized protein
MPQVIGRQAEQIILQKALQTDEAEMVAVIGRRRVGKTYLIRNSYGERIVFDITGEHDAPPKEQLQNFVDRLNHHARPILPFQRPSNWQQAFQMLIIWFESKDKTEKQVLFFDELPWLAGNRHDFLRAFGLFWNSWASQQNLVVVICGSAASWMIAKVIKDKGGLHNRITKRIFLQPFSLGETEVYLQSTGVRLSRYHIVQLYMAMGGIPHYLKNVESGMTATDAIDHLCFSTQAPLRDEFDELYVALFEQAESHISIVRTLANTWQGMTRAEIASKTQLSDGGNLTRIIEELLHSGFVGAYYSYGKRKKEVIYRLIDEYSLFYLQYIETNRSEGQGTWQNLSQTQTYKSWSGYAFESICLKHLPQIKKALGIMGVYTEASSYYLKKSELGRGVQIDLLLDRNDQAINLFEIKFYQNQTALTKDQAENIRMKKAIFQHTTQVKKHIINTWLSTFPLISNEHSLDVIDKSLDMDCLFEQV